jgi:ribulose-phosphate 3-epimerase
MPKRPLLAPSLLAADPLRLGEEIAAAEQGGADWLHLDVMDGSFVPNLSMGPSVVAACRRACSLPLDVHLMIREPERHLEAFAEAGAAVITVHAETSPHLHRTLERVHDLGCKSGLALNPLTPLAVLEDALPDLDLVLIMSVNPGFGGQSFIPGSLGRLRRAAELRDRLNPDCLLEVDGGIGPETIAEATAAGADVLVAGSAVFGGAGPRVNLGALREKLEAGS